ncbi:hypothetical protein [Halorussus marinus]|uniref:hypothetical protein n=1 Tax=Halorussus marinus TaxID=2505976 RepID=UPI00106EAE42|nr:hypothetical protein [Halorussus marinus]
MSEVREGVVEELDEHSETMTLREFVQTVERRHPSDRRGIDPDLLAAYAEAVYFDVDLGALDDRVTDSESWSEGERFYEVGDGRISAYPPDWHDAMDGIDDIRDVVELIQTEVADAEGDMWGAVTEERGVPESKVLAVGETVANIDREAARERIKELRQNGEIEEFASQHRNPTIRLS